MGQSRSDGKPKNIFEELTVKVDSCQENNAQDCLDIEELHRICREETEGARQLRKDELYAQKEIRTFHGESVRPGSCKTR